jgi:hypothetical protein
MENSIPDALTLFTDASETGMAAYYSTKGIRLNKCLFSPLSTLSCRLSSWSAVIFFTEAINAYTDSAYVAGVLCAIETAYIGHTNNEELFHLFCQLQAILHAHHHPYFVGHLHSHSGLPGPLAEGNQNEDALASPSCLLGHVNPCAPGSAVTQAVQSHVLYHQNSNAITNSSIFPENRSDKLLKPAKLVHNTSRFHKKRSTLMVSGQAVSGR